MKGEWLNALSPGSIAQMTSRGSMITEASVHWLTHFSHYKFKGTCLLVFVGATLHLDHSIVEAADRHDITLLCLPRHTTLELQLTHTSVFGPLEHTWDEQVLLFYSHSTDRTLTNRRLGNIFTVA